MTEERRPEHMARITTPELVNRSKSFALRSETGKSCLHCPGEWIPQLWQRC